MMPVGGLHFVELSVVGNSWPASRPYPALIIPIPQGKRKVRWKRSLIRVKTERSLINYHHGKTVSATAR